MAPLEMLEMLEMLEGVFWGTPEQVVDKFRAFGDAGLQHVVPFMVSPLVSPESATFSFDALNRMAHALRSGEDYAAG